MFYPYDGGSISLTLQRVVECLGHFDHIALIKRIGVRVNGKGELVCALIGVRVGQCRGSQQRQPYDITLGGVTVLRFIEDGDTVSILAHCSDEKMA